MMVQFIALDLILQLLQQVDMEKFITQQHLLIHAQEMEMP